MAHELDVVASAQEILKRYDRNDDGKLSREDVYEFLREYNPDKTDGEIEELFNAIDLNSDGEIDMNELVALYATKAAVAIEERNNQTVEIPLIFYLVLKILELVLVIITWILYILQFILMCLLGMCNKRDVEVQVVQVFPESDEPPATPVVSPEVPSPVEQTVKPEVTPVVNPEVNPEVPTPVEQTETSPGEPTADTVKKTKFRALLVGINYQGLDCQLQGCHNDVLDTKEMLSKRTPEVEFKILVDKPESKPEEMPTKSNIVAGLKWLNEGAQHGDKRYFHYSGHGSQVPDLNGDEGDNYDETLVPLDMIQSNWDERTWLTDDELRHSFFSKVPEGVDLTVVFDCCCSGTMADMKLRSRMCEPTSAVGPTSYIKHRFLQPSPKVEQMIAAQGKLEVRGLPSTRQRKNAETFGKINVVQISGCMDSQTSADAFIEGKFNGALTYSIMKAEREKSDHTLGTLFKRTREICKELEMQQKPQLHVSDPLHISGGWLKGWN